MCSATAAASVHCDPMRRSAVAVVMLFAMLWQSVALARVGSTINVLADLEHAALHWQEERHHHHDDGSFHLDDSNESVQHVTGDQVSTTTALLHACSYDFPPRAALSPRSLRDAPASPPFLEGPLRPPRLRA